MAVIDYNKWPIERLHVQNLSLDISNPRVVDSGETPSQQSIIDYLVEETNVLSLASSITDRGFFPTEFPIVVKEADKCWVLEGNRRVAACKLLVNPGLAPPSRRSAFAALAAHFNVELIRELRVIIAPTREEAETMIRSRHTYVPIEKWDKVKERRFFISHRSGKSIALSEKSLADKNNETSSLPVTIANRQLVIQLPTEFVSEELELIVLAETQLIGADTGRQDDDSLVIAKSFFGIAPSEVTFNEEDFYTQ